MPFGLVKNRRSLVYVGNLVSAIVHCILHEGVSGREFCVSDENDLSTADLIRLIASGLNKTPFLVPVPVSLLRVLFFVLRMNQVSERLLGSLVVDSRELRQEADWRPPYSTSQGIQATIDFYRAMRSST